MYKTIPMENLFYKKVDSYDVIEKSKEVENKGFKFVKVNDLVVKLSIKYFMYMVVSLSIKGMDIDEIYTEMKYSNNWKKDANTRYYDFKLLD